MRLLSLAVLLAAAGFSLACDVTCTFKKDESGKLPDGWIAAKTGKGKGSEWQVVADDTCPSKSGFALAQLAKGEGSTFNLCVFDKTVALTDVELTVALKAVDGEIDQGGGLLWRYKDADNYYVTRLNPLEHNLRFYKVVGGKRTQLASAEKLDVKAGTWYTLQVTAKGDKIEVSLDGKKLIDCKDKAITEGGHAGLWTKADARTRFDSIRIKGE